MSTRHHSNIPYFGVPQRSHEEINAGIDRLVGSLHSEPRFARLRALWPVIREVLRPAPCVIVWLAQLATIFWFAMHCLPANPLEGTELAEFVPEGFPIQYVTAGVVTALFLVFSLFNRPRRHGEVR